MTEEIKTPIDVNEYIGIEKIVNINEIKDNTLMILHVKEYRPLIQGILNTISARYGEELKKKNVTMVLLSPGETLESVEETVMNNMGWYKKGKIILPGQ